MLTDPVVDRSSMPPPFPPGLVYPTIHCTLGVEFSTASAARVISTLEPLKALAAARNNSSRLLVNACRGVSRESRLKTPTKVPGLSVVLMNSCTAATAHLRVFGSSW